MLVGYHKFLLINKINILFHYLVFAILVAIMVCGVIAMHNSVNVEPTSIVTSFISEIGGINPVSSLQILL